MKNFTKFVLAALAVLPMLAACETMKTNESAHAAIEPVMPAMPGGNLNTEFSNGSVEVYNLDAGGQDYGAGVASVMPDPLGIPMANDPRVIVYPLDGMGNDYPGQVQATLYSQQSSLQLMPPPTAIEGGKLSPRVGSGVSSVYFPYGSAKLDKVDRVALQDIAQTAKFSPVDRVSVEGHASNAAQTKDPIKAKILNLKESMNRAAAVSEHLIQTGVPAEKIKTIGWGDTKPSGGGEAAERRVDIVTGAGQ